jgi:hypothetical protein
MTSFEFDTYTILTGERESHKMKLIPESADTTRVEMRQCDNILPDMLALAMVHHVFNGKSARVGEWKKSGQELYVLRVNLPVREVIATLAKDWTMTPEQAADGYRTFKIDLGVSSSGEQNASRG